MGSVRDTVCADSWMGVGTGAAARLVGLLCGWLWKRVRDGSLASPFSSPMPFVVAFCLFFFLEVSPKQYKVTRGKIKASLFHSWVTVTDGHVHSAKTNSSSNKHNRVERGGRKNLPGSPFIAGSGGKAGCFSRCWEGHLNTCPGKNVSPVDRWGAC